MSRIPDNLKSKYNHDSKFIWVDAQLEKFMIRQKELESRIKDLELENKQLKEYFNINTESNQLNLFDK